MIADMTRIVCCLLRSSTWKTLRVWVLAVVILCVGKAWYSGQAVDSFTPLVLLHILFVRAPSTIRLSKTPAWLSRLRRLEFELRSLVTLRAPTEGKDQLAETARVLWKSLARLVRSQTRPAINYDRPAVNLLLLRFSFWQLHVGKRRVMCMSI